MSESDGPVDAQLEGEDNVSDLTRPTNYVIGALALLAVPLGFGGFLFFGVELVAWLPTPLRLVPYSVLIGCLLMAIYQRSQGAGLWATFRYSVATGVLAGLLSMAAFFILLVIIAGGGIH